MAKVVVMFTDEGMDGEMPRIGVTIESDPPLPLDGGGEPVLEEMTSAQMAAFGVAMGLNSDAGRSKVYTQDGDTITQIAASEEKQ